MTQIVIKYKKHKIKLEICCDKKILLQYKKIQLKSEKEKLLNKLLIVDDIFSNFKIKILHEATHNSNSSRTKETNFTKNGTQ